MTVFSLQHIEQIQHKLLQSSSLSLSYILRHPNHPPVFRLVQQLDFSPKAGISQPNPQFQKYELEALVFPGEEAHLSDFRMLYLYLLDTLLQPSNQQLLLRFKSLIYSRTFQFTHLRSLSDLFGCEVISPHKHKQAIFHNHEIKKLVVEFLRSSAASNLSVWETVNLHPILDHIFIDIINTFVLKTCKQTPCTLACFNLQNGLRAVNTELGIQIPICNNLPFKLVDNSAIVSIQEHIQQQNSHIQPLLMEKISVKVKEAQSLDFESNQLHLQLGDETNGLADSTMLQLINCLEERQDAKELKTQQTHEMSPPPTAVKPNYTHSGMFKKPLRLKAGIINSGSPKKPALQKTPDQTGQGLSNQSDSILKLLTECEID